MRLMPSVAYQESIKYQQKKKERMLQFATATEVWGKGENDRIEVKYHRNKDMGRSVWAKRDFKLGEKITSHGGVYVTSDDDNANVEDDDYVLRINGNTLVDGHPRWPESDGHDGKFINDAGPGAPIKSYHPITGLELGPNCRFSVGYIMVNASKKRVIWIVATRPITKGDELFLSYGRDFWKRDKRKQ